MSKTGREGFVKLLQQGKEFELNSIEDWKFLNFILFLIGGQFLYNIVLVSYTST